MDRGFEGGVGTGRSDAEGKVQVLYKMTKVPVIMKELQIEYGRLETMMTCVVH